MLLNTGVGEDSWESLGLQGDPTSQSQRKSVLNILWKDWCWSWSSNTLATWCRELTHWERSWCWERLKAGEGDNRGWNGWMASLTRWTRIWVISRSCWWTGKPCVLQSGVCRVGHNWATELTELKWMGKGKFNSDDHYIYYCGQESLRRTGIALIVNKRDQHAVLGCNLKNNRMTPVRSNPAT